MTTNQIDINSTELEINKLSLNLSDKTSPPQLILKKTQSPASKSEPNLMASIQDLETSKSPQQTDNNGSVPGTAYNYAASTISGAYSYMSSFYGANKSESLSLSFISKNGKIHNGIHYDASIPDRIKYPMTEKDGDSRQSDLSYLIKKIECDGIDNVWTAHFTEPLSSTVPLRSISYGSDGKKEVGLSPVFRLVHAQAFKTQIQIDNIAQHPCSWFNQNISADDMSCFTLIIHLQLKSIKTSFITYHVLNGDNFNGYNSNGTPIICGDRAVTNLLDLVLNCSDNNILNNRMKMVPRIVSGPYPVKRVVENRPVLLGNKVKQKYYRGSNYFEIDSPVDESMVAASIIKLCHRFAKRIVVDMSWTIQGQDYNELPERILCGCTIHNMNFDKCNDINYEIQNCPKLNYNFKKQNRNNDEHKENK